LSAYRPEREARRSGRCVQGWQVIPTTAPASRATTVPDGLLPAVAVVTPAEVRNAPIRSAATVPYRAGGTTPATLRGALG
jgi:hypothetical protein